MDEKKLIQTTLSEAFFVIAVILICLGACIIHFQMAPHVPILTVFAFLCLWGRFKGYSWDDIHQGIVKGIEPGIVPIIIFMLIGVLIASLISAGTVPTVVVYGYKIISARYLPLIAFILCMADGMTIGSSFTTISTMGVVLITLGRMSGVPDELIAGAIVSGAFFSNNMSPLADIPNLCTGIGKISLPQHLKSLAKSAIPTMVITIIIFAFLGGGNNVTGTEFNEIAQSLDKYFFVSPITLIPLILIFVCSFKRWPAIATLLTGIVSALIIYVLFAPNASWENIPNLIMGGYVSTSGVEQIDHIFSRGGLMSMMGSASMIILALAMGGLLVKLEIFSTVVKHIEGFVKSQVSLVIATAIGSILTNMLIGEQYLSVVLPGQTFKPLYEKMNIPTTVMTRTLADAGAAFNSIVPWSVIGTFIIGTLGLADASYILYSFYPVLLPIVSILLSLVESYRK